MSLIGQTVAHYKILEHLGGGGMGVVYKAQDLKLDRLVALKFLPPELTRDPEAKQRFVHEAKAASVLDYPNICNVHDIGETDDGQMFIVMAYYEGETLKKKIERGPLKIEEAVAIAMQIAEGLAKAHEHDIVHRDIKPANVMVTSDGVAKIVDFGLAKLTGRTQLTKTGSTLGTAAYMSPEQARGEAPDERTDLWSLGVTFYEMLTGHRPFESDYEQALVYSILNEDPKPMRDFRSEVPQALEKICRRAMAKEPGDRYESAIELIADLESSKTGTELSNRTRRLPAKKRRMLYVGAAVIVAAGILAFAALTLSPLSPWKRSSAESKSIAVLPFTNMNEDRESEYFSDGITDDIIAQLSKIADLRVISRTSVMQYKGAKRSLRDIARELDVTNILEGSVRRSGSQIRIVAQLIDATKEGHLWAETYDREMTQVFAIQSDVAQRIASALKAQLTPAEKDRLDKVPTSNVEAYNYYLKGREYYYRYRKEDNDVAIGLFRKALDLDPDYALAYAGLGDAYAQGFERFGRPKTWIDSARVLSERSVALDASLAEGHKALALAFEEMGWLRKAIEQGEKSVEANPSYAVALVNLGWYYQCIGELAKGFWLVQSAGRLNPAGGWTQGEVGRAYVFLENYDNAERFFKTSLALQPDYAATYEAQFQMYLLKPDRKRAAIVLEEMKSVAPKERATLQTQALAYLFDRDFKKALACYEQLLTEDTSGQSLIAIGYLNLTLGRQDEVRRVLERGRDILENSLKEGNEFPAVPYSLSNLYAVLGRKKEALEWLQKAIVAGWRDYRWALVDPLLENLRGDAAFNELISGVKLMVDEERKKVEAGSR